MKRLLLLAAFTCLGACNLDVAQPENRPTDPATETFDPSLGVDISKMTKTPTGAYYKEIKLGTGDMALVGQPFVQFTFIGFVKTGASFAAAGCTSRAHRRNPSVAPSQISSRIWACSGSISTSNVKTCKTFSNSVVYSANQ